MSRRLKRKCDRRRGKRSPDRNQLVSGYHIKTYVEGVLKSGDLSAATIQSHGDRLGSLIEKRTGLPWMALGQPILESLMRVWLTASEDRFTVNGVIILIQMKASKQILTISGWTFTKGYVYIVGPTIYG